MHVNCSRDGIGQKYTLLLFHLYYTGEKECGVLFLPFYIYWEQTVWAHSYISIYTLDFLPPISLFIVHVVIDNEDIILFSHSLSCRSAEEIAESPITKRAPGFQDFTSPLKGKKKRQLPIAPRRRGRAASGEDEGEDGGRGEGNEQYIHNIMILCCDVQVHMAIPFYCLLVPSCSFILASTPQFCSDELTFLCKA